MAYKLIMFKAEFETDEELEETGHIVSAMLYSRQSNENSDALVSFDTKKVLVSVAETFGEKCHAYVYFSDTCQKKAPYIVIAFSDKPSDLDNMKIEMVAAQFSLAIYDNEKHMVSFGTEKDRPENRANRRAAVFYQAIRHDVSPVFRIRRLEERHAWQYGHLDSYVVTLLKTSKASFEKRTLRFYACLKRHLIPGEELECDDRCFIISGVGYGLIYVLEGYKKHADRIGFVQWRQAHTELLHRMGCEEVFRILSKSRRDIREEFFNRMSILELTEKYPNPADRFVSIFTTERQQAKQKLQIECGTKYSPCERFGNGFEFHLLLTGSIQNHEELSWLRMDHYAASFILPFIAEFFPPMDDRYYEESHIAIQTWEKITERVREARDMILLDTANPAVSCHYDRFILSALSKDWETDSPYKADSKEEYVFRHRYEIARFYDYFIEWSESQIGWRITWPGAMIVVQGP